MQWKLDGNAPIYTQLVERMKLGIVSGEWLPGQRIPAVRELAAAIVRLVIMPGFVTFQTEPLLRFTVTLFSPLK